MPTFKNWGCPVITAANIENPDIAGKNQHNWDETFFKIRAAGLTSFDKIVLIDGDMLVRKNLNHLFGRQSMTAIASGKAIRPQWTQLNSGPLALERMIYWMYCLGSSGQR